MIHNRNVYGIGLATLMGIVIASLAPGLALADEDSLRLVIADEDVAAWMPISNTFTRCPGEDWPMRTRFWNGVLIQVGDYVPFTEPRDSKSYQPLFEFIVFKAGDQTVETLTRAELEEEVHWVNIVARVKGSVLQDPMTADDLGRLELAPPVSLHGFMRPIQGGITIWQDRGAPDRPGGYTVTSETTNHNHARFVFDIPRTDAFVVEIYRGGERLPLDLSRVDTITIGAAGDVNHGGHHNPPQY